MPQVFVEGFAEPKPSKAATIMGGLSDILNAVNERRQKNELELQQQLLTLYKYPQFADTLGEDIKRKWAKSKPHVASLIDAMQNQNQLERDAVSSQGAWAKAVAEEEKRRYDMRAELGTHADVVPIETPAFAMMGLPAVMPMPNLAKREALSAIDNLPDAQYEALMRMDPKQRELVVAQMMRDGKSLPQGKKALDPSKLSETARTLQHLGATPEQVLDAELIRAGMKLAPTELEKDAIHDANAQAEIEARAAAATEAFNRSKILQDRSHQYQTTEEEQRHRNLVSRGGDGEGGKEKAPPKTVTDSVNAVVESYVQPAAEAKADKERLSTAENAAKKATTPKGKADAEKALKDLKEELGKKSKGYLSPGAEGRLKEGLASLVRDMRKNNVVGIRLGDREVSEDELMNIIVKGYLNKIAAGTPEADAMKTALLAFDQARGLITKAK